MEKVDLRIVDLIHDITQLDYEIKFCSDFQGMTRLEFTKEYNDSFYEHYHIGTPGGSHEKLEKEIVRYLQYFLDNIKEKE